MVATDVPQAVEILKKVDTEALTILSKQIAKIQALAEDCHDCWSRKGRVFLAGCGATGRLSLALEVLTRETGEEFYAKHPVIGFMAGGDAALIKSIESFEDHPEYGARQLTELGFSENDSLIGITEGGETPFVIGATEAAVEISSYMPWFCYCNPDGVLARVAKRSQNVLENNSIKKLNLCVGPMAISGSTRMQASTVQMAAVGLAIFYATNPKQIANALTSMLSLPQRIDATALATLIIEEANSYLEKEYILYGTKQFGITVLTDTTERAPTFSLNPFENIHQPQDTPSLSFLQLRETKNSVEACQTLLKRDVRCLNWDFCHTRKPSLSQTDSQYTLYFSHGQTWALLRKHDDLRAPK